MKSTVALLALLLAFGLAMPASAHSVTYSTSLSGPAESPPNDSLGIGSSLLVINDHDFSMHITAEFSGLTGTVTISHIHCCTSLPFTSTAGVATPLPSFPDFPTGVTSGTYDRTFDLTQASSWNPAFITANGGTTASAFSALLAGLESGKAYLNIHTTFKGGGEIRGFYVLAPVPVPAAAWLFGSALAGLAGLRRRRV